MSVRSTGIALVLLGCLLACSKKDVGEAAASAASLGAVVESFEGGSIGWNIAGDGRIRAEVKDASGTPVTKDSSGTVEWKTESGETKSAKLTYDSDAKALVAAGPPPTQDITTLTYRIETKGAPLAGTLHVPVGGTAALANETNNDTTDAKGPHGGVIQKVGDDRLEIVADDDSDEVRVYVIGGDGKAIAAGERKVTLAVVAEKSEVVVLRPSDDGAFLVGTWTLKDDPSRVTVVLRSSGRAYVAIVGWKPGARLVVTGGAPRKIKVHVKGHGAKIDIKVKDGPGAPGMVKIDLKGNGGGKGKIKIK